MAAKQARRRGGVATKADQFKGTELGQIIAGIQKDKPDQQVVTGLQMQNHRHTETGIFLLDLALNGGLIDGQMTLLYGHEHSGKTTVALRSTAAIQRKHPKNYVVWFDMERVLDRNWAAAQGVDMSRLVLPDPATGEECVDQILTMIAAKEVAGVVLDSIDATRPMAAVESSAADNDRVAGHANLINPLYYKLVSVLAEVRRLEQRYPHFIAINQWRQKMVLMGDNRSLPGGRAQHFYSALKIEAKRGKPVESKDSSGSTIMVAQKPEFKIDKNKGGTGAQSGGFLLSRHPASGYPPGTVDDWMAVVSMASKRGFLTGGGAKQRLPVLPEGEFMRTQADLAAYLRDNREADMAMRRMLIAAHREESGLAPIPPDNYLVGYV